MSHSSKGLSELVSPNQSTNHESNQEINHELSELSLNSYFKSTEKIIALISFKLFQKSSENHLIKNYQKIIKKQANQIFTSKFIPKISVSDYLNRIVNYTKIEQSTLIIAFIYLNRFCEKQSILLNEYNTHRLIISSIMASIKYNEDTRFNYLFYSTIAGTDIKKLINLEKEFLYGLDFDMFIDQATYESIEKSLFENMDKCNNKM